MAKLTALAGLLTLASVQANAAVLLDSLNKVPVGWQAASAPAPESKITLQVALTQQNIDQLESKLAAVSTPNSSNYGKYLDVDEINQIFAPSSATTAAVESWLKSYGVDYKVQGSSIWFQTDVSTANKMLSTNFHTYTDSVGAKKVRTLQYSVPETLADHIDLISPTTYFGTSKAMRALKLQNAASAVSPLAARQEPSSCKGTIEFENRTFNVFQPDCLKTEYSVTGYKPSAKSGSRIGFGSFLNQSASSSDLALFEKHFGFASQGFSVELINGGSNPQPPTDANDGEANLDAQNIVSFVQPLPITEYIAGGSAPYFPDPVEPAGTPDENEPYLEYYEYLLSKSNKELPQVITNSYGDEEQTVPQAYAVRVCNLIGLMGLRGISILESSGDEGVGASCLATNSTTTPQFNPIFPATCPYVTSVGGTVSFNPEVAWDGSSGGFSYYFSRPWYQEAAVGTYLNKYVSEETKEYYKSYVDFSGRGFPDVAAHSVSPDYPVFQGGQLTPSGGTSAASPIVASVIALLNDARLRAGRPALGFLNPLIYGYAYKGFTDITSGQAVGCNGNNTQSGGPLPGAGVIPGAFWNATKGWDPTTGFGVPNFKKLLELVRYI
ncbi:hypothetical protein ACHAPV_003188 [Trichoderma viride]